ncbi:MAG: MopE-related protein [bacterium]|nr:MopE-related protein [bacterium]
MPRVPMFLFLLLTVACGDTIYERSCETNADCPNDWTCESTWCVSPQRQVPDINVTIEVPGDESESESEAEAESESESEAESENEPCPDSEQLGLECDGGDEDACPDGVFVCNADKTDVVCNDDLLSWNIESCNGLDDDCDGIVDELPIVDDLEWCGGSVGVCNEARVVCMDDGSFACEFPPTYGIELCDGLDNDCNGAVDEIFRTGECYVGDGVCRVYGTMACQSDGTNTCSDSNGTSLMSGEPTDEVCDDELDNNCDGNTDCGTSPCEPCE